MEKYSDPMLKPGGRSPEEKWLAVEEPREEVRREAKGVFSEEEKTLLSSLEVGLGGLLARGMNREAPLTGSTIEMARDVLGLGVVDSVGELWLLFC